MGYSKDGDDTQAREFYWESWRRWVAVRAITCSRCPKAALRINQRLKRLRKRAHHRIRKRDEGSRRAENMRRSLSTLA
jgi:hypothetical protein